MIPARIYYARLLELWDEYHDPSRYRMAGAVRNDYDEVTANLLRAYPHATPPVKLTPKSSLRHASG